MATKVEQTSFDLLGKRWSALIVQDLIGGPRRFREILGDLGRINDKVLSQRLKELEERGIVERRLFPEVPVRVEYSLTNKGRGLAGVINAMEQWDAAWSDGPPPLKNGAGAMRHADAVPSVASELAAAQDAETKGPRSFWRRLRL